MSRQPKNKTEMESPEVREQRLQKQREAYRRRVANLTDQEREAAKLKNRKRRLEQTEDQKNSRLQRERDRKRRRKNVETDEQRLHRQAADAKRKRIKQKTESKEQKQQRTQKAREARKQNLATQSSTKKDMTRTNNKLRKQRQKAKNLAQTANSFKILRSTVTNNEEAVPEHYLGKLAHLCNFCGAKHFKAEKTKAGHYTKCCQRGKVKLPDQDFPDLLKNLMTHHNDDDCKNFMENIRSINSSFAFASMGATLASPPGNGTYCFRINGQIYHRTGRFLHPKSGKPRQYAQLYVLDTECSVQQRLADKRNENCSLSVMTKIAKLITSINILAKSYRMLHEVEKQAQKEAKSKNLPMPNIYMKFKSDRTKDTRRYNLPNENDVAIVFQDAEGAPPFDRDILVYLKQDKALGVPNTRFVSILDVNLDAMVYPLFFPRGEPGWGPKLLLENVQTNQTNEETTSSRRFITQMQYYSYKLQIRDSFNPLLNGGKLTQQYIVDAYVRMEASRLNWIRYNQPALRAESYSGLKDHLMTKAKNNAATIGKMIILPSSFEGSPRNYHQRYQDAMAIVAKFGKPDLFVTMTCNPRWIEITENLEPWQRGRPEYRPDLVARVFSLKLNSLIQDINNGLFGKVTAMVYVIEFQKRGLPHAHILIILDEASKLRNEDDIDQIVCAELPDKNTNPILYDIVTKNMIHTHNKNSVCMENGRCTRKYPKDVSNYTVGNVDGYPKYRRRACTSIKVRDQDIDNTWVVPYNPYLLKKYNCHINVEICASIKSVKYLFKYVYKGHDRSSFKLEESNRTPNSNDSKIIHDEPKNYVDSRYVSAPEAMWRLFSFPMHYQSHTIIRLDVHLPDKQVIRFNEDDNAHDIANKMNNKSTLMAWFELNATDSTAHNFLYREIPEHYTFDKQHGIWKKKGAKNKVLGRMYFVNVKDEELYYLRLLLLHVRGATDFKFLRTYEKEVYPTFKDAARARGLLLDDQMWEATLEEAVTFNMPSKLRQLFAFICVFGLPTDARKLWEKFKEHITEDFCHRLHNVDSDCTNCEALALQEIETTLLHHQTSCANFGLPSPPPNIITPTEYYNQDDEEREANKLINSLNDQQTVAFKKIQYALEDTTERPKCFFLDGPGGSGKTYLYDTLIHFARSIGKQVVPTATTGIAANLFPRGKTMHSAFGLPLNIHEGTTSSITKSMKAGRTLRNADLIFIDECTMASKYSVNTTELLLRKEIMVDDQGNSKNIVFGGKVVLFGGDFRQCLPIIRNASRPGILENTLKMSDPWLSKHFEHLALSRNMRCEDPNYADWLLKLGEGMLNNDEDLVEIPPELLREDIVLETFGNRLFHSDIENISNTAILSPTNEHVDRLNDKVMDILDGDYTTYFSDDTVKSDGDEEGESVTVEFLNSITPSGMPHHELKLKVGTIVMLLRNLNTDQGLCNGTRLMVISLRANVIETKVLTGSAKNQIVLIPRIDLCPPLYSTGLPFRFNRRQFPVKAAFAMTINKAQGQTLDKVGIYLPDPVFAHGQLYVAFSRVRKKTDVKVQIVETSSQGKLLENSNQIFTRNVVYREVL